MPYIFTFFIILINVAIHYEGLRLLSTWLYDISNHRIHSILLMCGLTTMHLLEISIFTIFFWTLQIYVEIPVTTSGDDLNFMDLFNLSLTNFTTLAVSKKNVSGTARFISGMEGLNGFMLLTWSASFLYRGAGQFWQKRNEHR